MRVQSKLAVIAATMTLGTFPAVALGTAAGHPHKSTSPTKASKAKAYGKLCQGESKKHVAGQRGTPHSVCVSGAKKRLKQQAGG